MDVIARRLGVHLKFMHSNRVRVKPVSGNTNPQQSSTTGQRLLPLNE
jgi:hypothetical protein